MHVLCVPSCALPVPVTFWVICLPSFSPLVVSIVLSVWHFVFNEFSRSESRIVDPPHRNASYVVASLLVTQETAFSFHAYNTNSCTDIHQKCTLKQCTTRTSDSHTLTIFRKGKYEGCCKAFRKLVGQNEIFHRTMTRFLCIDTSQTVNKKCNSVQSI